MPLVDPSLPLPQHYPAALRVHTADGRVLDRRQVHVAGSPENPMPREEYDLKFVDNARRSLDAGKVGALLLSMRDLPNLTNMAHVAALYT